MMKVAYIGPDIIINGNIALKAFSITTVLEVCYSKHMVLLKSNKEGISVPSSILHIRLLEEWDIMRVPFDNAAYNA